MTTKALKITVSSCFTLFLMAFLAHTSQAATYYVDSSGGSDSNNGTSQSTAWKSTGKVNNTSFSPGDSILFKKGGVWRGQIKPASSGTSASPITYGSYGTGNAPLIINGKFFPAGTSWSGPGSNGEYTLNAGSGFASSTVGIVRGQPTGTSTYKRIFQAESLGEDQGISESSGGNIIIHYKPLAGHNPSEYDWEFSQWDAALYFTSNISWVVVDGFGFYNSSYSDPVLGVVTFFGSHCTVKNSTVRFANVFGVEFAGRASQYNSLENSDVQYGRSAGVDLRDGPSHNTIKNNLIANNSLGTTSLEIQFDRGGIMTLGDVGDGAVTYTTVEGNIIHDNANNISSRNNGAILMDGCQYWTIKNNYIYNSPRRAIGTSDNDGSQAARNHHLDIQYNVISRWDLNHDSYPWNSAIDMTGTLNDSNSGYDTVENNVIYSDDNFPLIGINLGTSSSSNYLKNTSIINNIVYLANNTQSDSVGIRVNRNNVPGMSASNNMVFGPKTLYEFFGGSYSSASACSSATGFCKNDKNTNPLLANASGKYSASADFKLAANSPAIDAGTSVNLTSDFSGTKVPQGSAPDIGAYEFTSGTTPPPPPPALTGDLNADNAVNLADFNILKTDFLKLAASLTNSKSDINADGQVTIKDVGMLMSGWK